ncbi:kinase-like protein [Hesseltinella vesiculosa]|uniref:Kinase-like protein n=1 Tax=Hesseltinella vesiculosa TaxID=101127 RepID=A0A1X2GR43_9FUNG|nr:kinase-like protein [Hesseltinella vesiculosa]
MLSDQDMEETKKEISLLMQLRHDTIIQFIGLCTSPRYCLVTDYCAKGDLYHYFQRTRNNPPGFKQKISYMYDIAWGVSYLHGRRPPIAHRDIKSMNILIDADDRAKVADFGLARIRERSNTVMHTSCGTINWQAPEIWRINPSYTEKADVYSLGLVFWEILTWGEKGYPYQSYTEQSREFLFHRVRDCHYRPSVKSLEKSYPSPIILLMKSMWDPEPKRRPSMDSVAHKLRKYLQD